MPLASDAAETSFASALPARGASIAGGAGIVSLDVFASALPARGASTDEGKLLLVGFFASALPARGASAKADKLRHTIL